MKKYVTIRNAFMAVVLSIGAFGGYQSYNYTARTTIKTLFLENVEALAQLEQPNVDDCIKDDSSICEALHPTDPSKDKKRYNARW